MAKQKKNIILLNAMMILFLLTASVTANEKAESSSKSAGVLLQEAIYAEETEGNLDKAIEIYQQVIDQAGEIKRMAARATYQVGMCYLKKGEKEKAAEYFQQVVSDYSTQKTIVEKANEQLGKIGIKKIIEGNLFDILGTEVCSYIGSKYGEICAEAGVKKLYCNSCIYFVDKQFTLRGGYMGYVYNWTGKPITEKFRISGTKIPTQKFYEIKGNPMNVEIVPDEQRKGFYNIFWNPKEPLGQGEFFNYASALDGSLPLQKNNTGKDYQLMMNNRFKDHCYEVFFLVVPEGMVLENLSEVYTNKSSLNGWDIYWWKKEVPENTDHTVNVCLAEASKTLKLNSTPYPDKEELRYNINTMVGMKCGEIIYSVEVVEVNGKQNLRIESYMNVAVDNSQQFTRVDVNYSDLTPVYGRTKNQMGDFIANYKPNKVELLAKTNGKEQKREISVDGKVYDNEQAIYIIRRIPLQENYSGKFMIFPVQGGAVVECRISVTGKEKISVPSGNFDCYALKLALYSGQVKALEHSLWFSADDKQYLVKYDSGAAIMELTAIGLKADKPQIIKGDEGEFSITIPQDWQYCKNDSMGMYKTSIQLLPPELKAWSVFTTVEKTALPDSARQIAEADVGVLKGFFKNYIVRDNSWMDLTINGLPAVSFTADYEDKGTAMAEYRTYILGESLVYWFVFRVEKDKFEENKADFDSIIKSFKINAK